MRKSFIISSLTALAALCLCATAQAQGPMVVSDKDDYSPGETAMFSASGFGSEELLDFSIAVQDDQGLWLPDVAWADIPADASGGAEVDYIVPESWAGKTLQLTVMGLTSGLMAQTTFTDTVISLNINSPTMASPVHVSTAGGSINVNVTYSTSGPPAGDDKANVHFQIDGVGADPEYNGSPNNQTNADFAVDVPAGLTPGCHSLTLQVARGGSATDTETCAIIVDAPATPTPTPTATPTPTPCMNQPPVITCASPAPTPDLGQAIGCLDNGGSFSSNFPVTYSTDPEGGVGTSVTVKATFTKADNSTTTVDVATVTDPDGDNVTVSLMNGTNPVTISGPGSGSTPFSVDIHAEDDNPCTTSGGHTADGNCGGTASAEILFHVTYLPPLDGQRNCKVKQGSTVPVKMRLSDSCGHVFDPNNIPGGTPTLDVQYLSGSAPNGDPTVDNAGNSGDTCNTVCYFRWSPAPDLFWIFNLKTNSGYYVGNSYEIWPSNVDAPAYISIK
jgi:hypothetical protein